MIETQYRLLPDFIHSCKMIAENVSFIEQYPFHVVQFVTRGKQSSERSIDIVCTSWMRHDGKKNKIFVKYPPPPYNNENLDMYENHIKLKLDPMENWKEFHVKIKGKAVDFESALTKCEELKSSITALTMESDVSVGTAEKKAADKIKQLQLQQKATSLKKSISSKDYNQSSASTSKNKSAIEQLVESLVDPQNMENLNKDLQVPSIESSTLKPSSKNKRNIAGKTTSTKPTYQNHKSTIKNGVSSNKNLPKLWNTVAQQVTFESKKSDDILPSTKTSALAGIMDLLQDCYAEIKGLKKDVCALTEEVRLMRSSGGKSGDQSSSFVGTIKQLNDKYKYQLPCIYKSEFEEFESDLSTNEQLCIDVKNVLLTGIDSSLVISKSIVKMLKLFLEKDVAIHYTAIKATEKKKAILNTQLFQWILAVIKERRTMASQETHQDHVHSALSSVMSNVPSWKLTSVRAIEMKKLKEDSSAKTTTIHNSNDKNLNLPSSKNQASGQNNLTNALVDNINSSSNSSEDSYISENDDSQSSEGEMNSEFAKSLYVQLS